MKLSIEMPEIEYLEWDSNLFGYKIGKLVLKDLEKGFDPKRLIETIKTDKYSLVYCFVEKITSEDNLRGNVREFLATSHCKLVDRKATFFHKLNKTAEYEFPAPVTEFQLLHPTAEIIKIGLESGKYSRFAVDTNFQNDEFKKLYEIWIQKSVEKAIAEITYVVKEDDQILGLLTLAKKRVMYEIGLLATSSRYRGKGIGSLLIAAAKSYCVNNSVFDLQVVTQLDNLAACLFYQKNGFELQKTDLVYHLWTKNL